MVTFMGIGLVGPILPSISEAMDASPTQTSLLFTSYLAVTAVVMFFTSWVSSILGTRTTMLIGLAVIVASAIGCALSTTITSIIGFRALWGLGNALFLSTALAAIVLASGGRAAHAVMLYEAALGMGLAVGPLAGGILGNVEWAYAFWGTASLLATGFVAIVTVLRASGRPTARASATAPFRALADRRLLVLSIAAFLYNSSFFVTLAYAPYPLEMSAVNIGFVMTGFGAGLALTSVAVAPRLAERWSALQTLIGFLVVFAATHVAAALATGHRPALIVCIVLLGFEIGGINTVLTEAALEATTLPRTVASSAYSGVRFFGGAIGAPIGTGLASYGAGGPFLFAAATLLLAAVLLVAFRHVLRRADHPVHEDVEFEAVAITVGDA